MYGRTAAGSLFILAPAPPMSTRKAKAAGKGFPAAPFTFRGFVGGNAWFATARCWAFR